jgi:hypothetical protein
MDQQYLDLGTILWFWLLNRNRLTVPAKAGPGTGKQWVKYSIERKSSLQLFNLSIIYKAKMADIV